MKITIFTSNKKGDKGNCLYPNKLEVSDKEEMKEAVKFDHVCALYKGKYRSNDNFIESNDVIMDCDNDHSEDPKDWVTPESFAAMEPNIDFIATPSRNNMISKDGKAPRPKWHAHFPVDTIRDKEEYVALKKAINSKYPFFDDNALDAARFFFGTDCKEVFWQEGWMTIADVMDVEVKNDDEDFDNSIQSGPILEGSRNNTMSHFAGRILKRFGVTVKAKEAFLERAEKCDPPLEESELNAIWISAVKFFNKKISSSDGYVPPEVYNAEFGDDSLRPDDYSDIGEAVVLAREYGNELKYTKATDYLRHDGSKWVENGILALGAVEEFMDLQLADAKEEVEAAEKALIDIGISEQLIKTGGVALQKVINEKHISLYFRLLSAQTYFKFVMRYRNYKNLVNTQNAAKPFLLMDVNKLDNEPFLLNTPKGTLDLRDSILREHRSEDLITKITRVTPDDNGKDIWEEALNTFFCGDKELIEYVQMIVGLSAIGKVYQEHLIIAYGDGANGKSTFWNTIFRVMGDYAGKISAEALTMNNKRNVKPEMAELKGKRLIIASETEEGMRLNTSIVKQLCSTDPIQAEKKYKDPFSFEPSHTLVLYTNHLPKVGANDDGIWRRLVVIPFNAKIKGKSDIKNYTDYLYEKAAGAILQWIIDGANKIIKANFKASIPKVVKDAVAKYHEDNDWLGQFISECCDVDKANKEKSGELYQAYRAYCLRTGEYVRSTTDFYSAMEKSGFDRHRSSKGVQVRGLSLKEFQEFLE